MKDINGKNLAVGQIVVVACKDQALSNCPVLKKAKIIDLKEPTGNQGIWNDGYIEVKYESSGREVTIDGYLYMTDKRFCIID